MTVETPSGPGQYRDAIRSFVGTVQTLAARERELEQLRETLAGAREAAQPLRCRDPWQDGDDRVCGLHDFMWEDDAPFCNRVGPDLSALLELLGTS